MSILKEIYEYKINFVNKQKKLHTQSDILNKLKNITSHDFSFSKKLKKLRVISRIKKTNFYGSLPCSIRIEHFKVNLYQQSQNFIEILL